MRKKTVVFLLLGILISAYALLAQEEAPSEAEKPITNLPKKNIAYLYDGDSIQYVRYFEQIRKEIKTLSQNRLDVEMLEAVNGHWDPAEIAGQLISFYADPDIDLIIVSGYLTVLEVQKNLPPQKPVIIADFIDAEVIGLPNKEGKSGVPNLSYIDRKVDRGEDIQAFKRVASFDQVDVMIDPAYQDIANRLKDYLGDVGVEINFLNYQPTADQTLKELDGKNIKALMLAPSRMNEEEFQKFINGVNERKIPTYSLRGYTDVEKGALAGRMPRYIQKFARRVAINVMRVLEEGENAGDIETAFQMDEKLVVNLKTAKQLDLSLSFDVLWEAEVLFHDEMQPTGPMLTVETAVDEALDNNWLFQVRNEEIRITRDNYFSTWTEYLPHVRSFLDYRVNDSSRARNLGQVPKWTYNIGGTLNQLIYSDPVIRDIQNTGIQVDISKLFKVSSELDITQQTINAYLNYLRTKALLRVEIENLNATKHHLDLSKTRQQVGVGGPEEVFRWESELSETQANVLLRRSAVHDARITLNQLMNHMQETPFEEEDIVLESYSFYIGSAELEPIINNMKALMSLINYSVNEAVANSPEIETLDLNLKQQMNSEYKALGRFVLPEASLTGTILHRLKDKFLIPPLNPDSSEWDMTLRMSYPLFEGGERLVDFDRQKSEYRRVKFTKFLKMQQLELDVRRSVYGMTYTYPSIELTRSAMISATKNLDIVVRKYSEGTASVTDVIDSQNEKFRREARAVIAVYDFVENLTAYERAISRFYSIEPEDQRKAWLDQVKNYLASRGI